MVEAAGGRSTHERPFRPSFRVSAQMWYIAAPAARASCSATSAIVEAASTARAARGGVGEDAGRALADGAVEELDDLEHGHLGGRAGEAVAALDAALGAQDAGAPERGEELLEELDRDLAAAGELGDRHRAAVALAVQLDERAQRVRGLAGDRDHRRRRSYDNGRRGGAGARAKRRAEPAHSTGGADQIQPRSVAIRTAWARSIAPSLPYTLCRCVRTVLVERPSSPAICL